MFNEKELNILKREYAKLIVIKGLNLKPGTIVHAKLPLVDLAFNQMLIEECYKAKAKRVLVDYIDEGIDRLHYLYADKKELCTVHPYIVKEQEFYTKYNVAELHAFSHDYEAMRGVDPKLVSDVTNARSKVLYKQFAKHMFSCHWSGFALPSLSWAKKLFPKCSEKEAFNKLWEVIFKCCYVEKNKTLTNWKRHDAELKKRAKYLNSLHIKSLHYTSKNGTDLTIGLIKDANFLGGSHFIGEKDWFNPNFPTEEVFTTPHRLLTEGIVYSSKPLLIDGTLVKDFSLRFKKGRIVEVHAKANEKKLKDAINVDENAHYLGEVALVPFSSPINQSNILFYDSLYDENACCHFAFGFGYPVCVKNYTKYNSQQLFNMGVNESDTHIDFMIGTRDLKIVATTHDNKKIVIFNHGTWVDAQNNTEFIKKLKKSLDDVANGYMVTKSLDELKNALKKSK